MARPHRNYGAGPIIYAARGRDKLFTFPGHLASRDSPPRIKFSRRLDYGAPDALCRNGLINSVIRRTTAHCATNMKREIAEAIHVQVRQLRKANRVTAVFCILHRPYLLKFY